MKNESRTSAIGLARYAREYYDSAIAADEVVGTRPGYEIHAPAPVMFLVAHAIELSIKSYLRHQGYTLSQLKCLSHDISECWEEAEEKGIDEILTLSAEEKSILNLIGRLHASTELRYIKTGFKEFPVFGPLQELAEKILDGVCPYVGYR